MRRTAVSVVCIWALGASSAIGCGNSARRGGDPVDAGAPGDGGADVDAGPPAPPARCASFTAPGPGPSFRDATADWDVDATGVNVSAADLDGDGWADLIIHAAGGNVRNDFTKPPRDWIYHVLMNRPKDGGGRHFVDRTLESGYGALREPVADVGRAAQLAVMADVDDDGDLDVFSSAYANRDDPAADVGDRSELLLNDGTGVFSLDPVRQPAIMGSADGRAVPSVGASFVDYDRDGWIDLFVGYWYYSYGRSYSGVQDKLSRGMGGGLFEEVTDSLGLTTPGAAGTRNSSRATYGVTACDIDLDGDADLIESAYGREWNQLWLQQDGAFRDVAQAAGYDGDTNIDYSDNEFYRCYCASIGGCPGVARPRVTCGTGGWNAGVDDQPWRNNGNTFTTACGDVDDDGDQDLYTAEIHHWHIGGSSDSSELLLNTGADADGVPVFERPGDAAMGLSVPHVGASWNEGGISAGMADLDNDGFVDILLGTSDYPDQFLWIYRQNADRTFGETSAASGVQHACGHSFAAVDLDRDGDLDLVVTSSTARDCARAWPDGPETRVYENLSGQDADWTQIHLEGAGAAAGGANRAAIGTVVRVTAGGVTRTREVQGGYGVAGQQHDLDVTIGLGGACMIDDIEVRWPDAAGTVEHFTNVPARYRLVIRQGEGLTYLSE